MSGNSGDAIERSVAIVGIGCRFPGGIDDPGSFWRFLLAGGDAITAIPRDRIDIDHYFDARPATPGRMMTRWGGFLGNLQDFDPFFFGISPREAERLDPQQRLILETGWEALEDAGQNVAALEGSHTGVFVGQWLSDFESRLFSDPEAVDFYMTTGSGRYATSGRLSYLLGLRGPSLTVDTACSSSLVAVHMAVRSIRSGESTIALAGGVNTILQPHVSVAYSQSRMMAPDGHCKFGDASGDGYVRSEGAGLVVLKPLERALADGDRIYAVIRGSAVNNDGRSSGSMGTPSRIGQEELLREAYRDAEVSPGDVGYVEAHGTGTRAGDPVEIGALGAVLGQGRVSGRTARVGSVKSNLGHTEGAAGVAGLIKAALCLHHQAIPASLNCKQLNPAIPWEQLPVELVRTQQPWPSDGCARIAGVSAFGIAGTNAHIVLEGVPPATSAPGLRKKRANLLALSARSPAALAQLAAAYARKVESAEALSLGDLCANAAIRRTPMEYRAAFSVESNADLAERLNRFVAGEKDAAQAVGQAATPRTHRIAFVFPGQGSQWVGMARELSERSPVFAAALAKCEAAMRPFVDWSLREQLLCAAADPAYRMDDIAVIQPVLLAVEIALGRLWCSMGIEPVAVIGHSMGEVGAAYFAGALSLEDAMAVICRRSALMRKTSGRGAMAVVELSIDELSTRLEPFQGRVSVAVSNAPRSSVMSGDPECVAQVLAQLEREGIFARQVKVDVASHSPQMDPLVPELVGSLTALHPTATHIDLYSTVLGRRVEGAELDTAYWGRNLRQPVLFGATVESMLRQGVDAFIELSPHPLLLGAISQVSESVQRAALTLQSTRRQEPEECTLLASLGALFAAGHPVDWTRLWDSHSVPRLDLPKYPWQRERYWLADIEPTAGGRMTRAAAPAGRPHPLLGSLLDLATDDVRVWECGLDAGRTTFAGEHRLHGVSVLSAAALVETFLAAGRASLGTERLELTNIVFERAAYLEPGGRRTLLQVRATVASNGEASALEIFSRHENRWRRHAYARAEALPQDAAIPEVIALPASGADTKSSELYRKLQVAGVEYGATLRSVESLRAAGTRAFAQLGAVDIPEAAGCIYPPALLEGCFQVAVATAPEFIEQSALVMPRTLACVRCLGPAGNSIRVQLERSGSDAVAEVDLVGTDESGRVCLEMRGLRLQAAGAALAEGPESWLHEVVWEPAIAAEATSAAGRWLLLTGPGDASKAFAGAVEHAIKAVGGTPMTLVPGTDFAAQLERLRREPGAWRAVIHCAAWDAPANDRVTAELLEREPVPGAATVLQTVRSLDSAAWEGSPRLWVATSGAQLTPEDHDSSVVVAQTPLWGLGGALASEHPDRFAAIVDLSPVGATEANAARLVSEVLTGTDDPAVSLRSAHRYVARLGRVAAAPQRNIAFRPDATVLLTGGLGGVGAHVAEWLVARGARRLLLAGRSPIPPRAEWSGLPIDAAAAVRVRQLRKLEALGAEVHYACVDVSDRSQVTALLDRWAAEGRAPIRSVFHAAGTTDDRLLARLDAASIDKVFSPKARAAWLLHELLGEVDHFVLFSSVASVWANAGQGAYAAANAFLDGLARHRRASGLHATSVSWGVWADTGFGATAGGREARKRLEADGLRAFAPADALLALGAALRTERAHLAVLQADWSRWRASAGRSVPRLLRTILAAMPPATEVTAASAAELPFLDEWQAAPADRRLALLEERIARHASSILKLPSGRLDSRKPLGSYGLDSIMAIELRNRLERDTALPLSATLIWSYPTVEALAALFAGKLAAGATPAVLTVPVAPDTAQSAGKAVFAELETLSDEDALAALRSSGGRRK